MPNTVYNNIGCDVPFPHCRVMCDFLSWLHTFTDAPLHDFTGPFLFNFSEFRQCVLKNITGISMSWSFGADMFGRSFACPAICLAAWGICYKCFLHFGKCRTVNVEQFLALYVKSYCVCSLLHDILLSVIVKRIGQICTLDNKWNRHMLIMQSQIRQEMVQFSTVRKYSSSVIIDRVVTMMILLSPFI